MTRRIKYALIGMIVGVVLGVFGVLFIQHHNPTDEKSVPDIVAASVVFERIKSNNELVCASQSYNITEKATDSIKIFLTDFNAPFTESSLWYRYVGTIKASVNLETAEFKTEGDKITVTLDQPQISSNTPDMEKSCVLEENNSIFNPLSISKYDEFRKSCEEQSQTEAIEGGLLEEAKVNAEENIRGMFNAAMGDAYKVEFEWREA